MTEKQKYDRLWQLKRHHSLCATRLPHYVHAYARPGERILDIGCGDGTSVRIMREMGLDAWGVDISLKGLRASPNFFDEAPVWDMLHRDNCVDISCSTDLLEHLPEDKVEAAISEICRVTKRLTIHFVETAPDEKFGMTMHLTLKPPEWWEEQFQRALKPGLSVKVLHKQDLVAWQPNPNTQGYWDSYWSRTDKDYPRVYGRIVEILKEINPRSVFDVGCGKGVLLSKIHEAFPDIDKLNLFGVDISGLAIDAVLKKGFVAKVRKIPPLGKIDKFVDVVIGSEILEHVDDWQYLLAEMERVGRSVIIAVPNNCMGDTETHRHVFTRKDFPGYTVEKMRERKVPILLAWREGE